MTESRIIQDLDDEHYHRFKKHGWHKTKKLHLPTTVRNLEESQNKDRWELIRDGSIGGAEFKASLRTLFKNQRRFQRWSIYFHNGTIPDLVQKANSTNLYKI